MSESRIKFALAPGACERVVVHVDSLAARRIGALAVLSLFCRLIVLAAKGHDRDWHAGAASVSRWA